MVTVTLFIIIKKWTQPKYVSVNESINVIYTYTEYHSASLVIRDANHNHKIPLCT